MQRRSRRGWRAQARRLAGVFVATGVLAAVAALAAPIADGDSALARAPFLVQLLALAAVAGFAALAPGAARGARGRARRGARADGGARFSRAARGCRRRRRSGSARPVTSRSACCRSVSPSGRSASARGGGRARSPPGSAPAPPGALLGELACHRGGLHVLVHHVGAWLLIVGRLRADLAPRPAAHLRALSLLAAAAVVAGLVAVAGHAAGAAVQPVGLEVHAAPRRTAGEAGRAHAGAGAAHLGAGRAGRLHIPQWTWLLRVSTQPPLQSVWPPGQPQTPFLHTCSSLGQVLKQSRSWCGRWICSRTCRCTRRATRSADRRRSRSRCRPGRCRSAQTLPQPRQLFGSR